MKPIKVRYVGPDQQESIPDRLLRIAREAGYEPTGIKEGSRPGIYRLMFRDAWVALSERCDASEVQAALCILVPKATDKRATVPCTELGEEPLFGLPTEKPGRLSASVRTVMVNEIIAAQCAAGGVDTPGTRAEAERWCAMLAGCVCEGMRATTGLSRHRLAKRDHCRSAGIDPRSGRLYECSVPRGTPLGRP